MKHTLFLFGEAEKGPFCTPIPIYSLVQLAGTLGSPPTDTVGIAYAVQALLYERELIFYRVKEEGFSRADYMHGIRVLGKPNVIGHFSAICLPGVGSREIIEAADAVCLKRGAFLIASDSDLYDFLTDVGSL
jgi:hypothetical protein